MNALIILGAKYLFLAVLAGAFGVFWTIEKVQRRTFVVTAVVATIVAIVLTKSAGALYFDPRPFTHGVTALIPHEPDNGFPSDHTVLSFAAASIAYVFSKKFGIALLVIALLVGVCRVLAGIHSPIDIIAGALIGIVAGWCGVWVMSWWESRNEAWSVRERM